MVKSDLRIGMMVHHRNLGQDGVITSVVTGDITTCIVSFDDDEKEVSVNLLDLVE